MNLQRVYNLISRMYCHKRYKVGMKNSPRKNSHGNLGHTKAYGLYFSDASLTLRHRQPVTDVVDVGVATDVLVDD